MVADNTIRRTDIEASLTGRPPKPFRVGRRLELFMSNGRIVRGVVQRAGRKASLMTIGMIAPWTDADGNDRPGYPHINLIPYRMVVKWRVPVDDAPDGTWMPGNPMYRVQLNASNANPVRDIKGVRP